MGGGRGQKRGSGDQRKGASERGRSGDKSDQRRRRRRDGRRGAEWEELEEDNKKGGGGTGYATIHFDVDN